MGDLRDIIVNEFGGFAMRLPDPIKRGWIMPLSNQSRGDFLRTALENPKVADEFYYKIHCRLKDLKRENQESWNALELRAIDHDLLELWGGYVDFLGYVNRFKEREIEMSFIDMKLPFLVNFRLLASAVAYMASDGDPSFISFLPSSQLEYFLGTQRNLRLTNQTVVQGSILNPEYSSFYQICKDARSDFTFRYSEQDGMGVLCFQDHGPGIIDKEGVPLPPERIHEIFEGFTSRGDGKGGVGLQVAKRLMGLRGGFIEVESSTKDGTAAFYSTGTGEHMTIVEPDFLGTKFRVYFPTAK